MRLEREIAGREGEGRRRHTPVVVCSSLPPSPTRGRGTHAAAAGLCLLSFSAFCASPLLFSVLSSFIPLFSLIFLLSSLLPQKKKENGPCSLK